MRLYIYVLSYQLSYLCSYLFHFLSLHKSLAYPAFMCIFCMINVMRIWQEYSSAKYQGRNWRGTLGTMPPRQKSRPFQKEYKEEISHLVLPHFNFWIAVEKCFYVPISTGCRNNSKRIIQRWSRYHYSGLVSSKRCS